MLILFDVYQVLYIVLYKKQLISYTKVIDFHQQCLLSYSDMFLFHYRMFKVPSTCTYWLALLELAILYLCTDAGNKRPNIVVIVADDLVSGHLNIHVANVKQSMWIKDHKTTHWFLAHMRRSLK